MSSKESQKKKKGTAYVTWSAFDPHVYIDGCGMNCRQNGFLTGQDIRHIYEGIFWLIRLVHSNNFEYICLRNSIILCGSFMNFTLTDSIQSEQYVVGDWMNQRMLSPINLGATCSLPLSPSPPNLRYHVSALCCLPLRSPNFFSLPELYSIGHILIWPHASYVEKSLSDQHPTHWILTIEIKSNNVGSQQFYTMLYKEATMAALATVLKAGSP